MNFRQALLRAVLAAAAVSLVLAGPSFGVRQAAPSKNGNLRDFVRSGALHKPTAAQRAAVRALHARATWNTYGTPSTLMRPRGFLSKQARGATPTIAISPTPLTPSALTCGSSSSTKSASMEPT